MYYFSLIVTVIIYLLLIIDVYVSNDTSIRDQFFLIFYSLIFSSLGTNCVNLIIIIIIQFIAFFGCIRNLKTVKGWKNYLMRIICSLFSIVAITCTYGYYYMHMDIIDFDYSFYFKYELFFISNLINGIITGLHVFYYSLEYYFTFTSLFSQRMQFITGIFLAGIVMEQLFESIRKELTDNHK